MIGRDIVFSSIDMKVNNITMSREKYEEFREKVIIQISKFFDGKTVEVDIHGKFTEPETETITL